MTHESDISASPTKYRSFWTDLFGWSFKIGWVDAGGIRTRYIEAGDPDSPTVVMLHGIGGSLELFVPNVGPLSEHFHVLAFDFLGFGLSDKVDHDLEISDYVEHLEAFMAAKGVSFASFFSVSLGSWVSVAFTARHPDRVDRLVLIAPAGLLNAPAGAAKFMQDQAYDTVDNPTWERLNETFDHLVLRRRQQASRRPRGPPGHLARTRHARLDPPHHESARTRCRRAQSAPRGDLASVERLGFVHRVSRHGGPVVPHDPTSAYVGPAL
jgi:pimeloyl-ACP methyl ester carboxylesterase